MFIISCAPIPAFGNSWSRHYFQQRMHPRDSTLQLVPISFLNINILGIDVHAFRKINAATQIRCNGEIHPRYDNGGEWACCGGRKTSIYRVRYILVLQRKPFARELFFCSVKWHIKRYHKCMFFYEELGVYMRVSIYLFVRLSSFYLFSQFVFKDLKQQTIVV